MKKSHLFLITLFLALLTTILFKPGQGMMTAWAAGRGTIVIFNANWCASCREVTPLVREVAAQNNLAVTEIDVDSQTAPKTAQSLGLSIPSEEPPQVFYVNHGRTALLYNGRGFRYGTNDAVRATILQNLQQVQP